jgi:FkbM family methyltransferase
MSDKSIIMKNVDFLQIGSHVGNTQSDKLFNQDIINKNIILIEPVPFLFNLLMENYKIKDKNNILFLNLAISNKNDTLELYSPSINNDFSKYPFFASQLTSANKDHISTHNKCDHLIVDKISVQCFTLNKLIEMFDIKSIDYLMIDTEGHDYDILMDFNLDNIKPNKICFENKHTDGTFIRGKNYIELINKLYKYGYKLIHEDSEDTIVTLSN